VTLNTDGKRGTRGRTCGSSTKKGEDYSSVSMFPTKEKTQGNSRVGMPPTEEGSDRRAAHLGQSRRRGDTRHAVSWSRSKLEKKKTFGVPACSNPRGERERERGDSEIGAGRTGRQTPGKSPGPAPVASAHRIRRERRGRGKKGTPLSARTTTKPKKKNPPPACLLISERKKERGEGKGRDSPNTVRAASGCAPKKTSHPLPPSL